MHIGQNVTKHIGILLTCVDDSDFAKRFPDDGEKFRQLLQPLRPSWKFTTVPVKDGIFPDSPKSFDGYVITGSPKSVNGDEPWVARLLEFIRQAEAQKVPQFGACFGHQAIAKALGGTVETSAEGWGLGTAATHFDKHTEWMTPRHDHLILYAAHGEQVAALPMGAELLGGDAHCPIGAYRVGAHVFATEYHPEMTPEFMNELLGYLDDKLDAATMNKARATLAHKAQGADFAQWIINFLDQ
jgi:GMP synthase-like glutamine amidotransferase